MTVSIFVQKPGQPLEKYDSLKALKNLPPEATVWVDAQTESVEDMTMLAEHFGLHELAIEDCLTPGHFPKIEHYGHYVFMILRSLKPWSVVEDIWKAISSHLEETDETIKRLAQKIHENEEEGKLTRKVAIFLADKFIITHRRREISWVDALVRQISQSSDTYLSAGTDTLAHRVIDVLIDRFLRGINFFDGIIEKAEDDTIALADKFDIGQMLELKRAMIWLRQIVRDQRGVISRLANDQALPVSKQRRRYFRDIEDHVQTIADTIDKQIDSINGVRDAYFASANVRLADTMRILAIITTIAAPLNIVVGVYGMNFEHMPLIRETHGFFYTITAMVGISLLMLIYFKRKRWL